jgi:hypothetical protein
VEHHRQLPARVRSGQRGHGVPRVLEGQGAGQRHHQIASGCQLHDARAGPGAERATCRIACADRDDPSFARRPSRQLFPSSQSADQNRRPPSRSSEAPGPGPERLGRRGRRRATTQSRRARRPPSHGRAGTPSPQPELCDYSADDASPSATTSKPAQNIQIRRGEVTGHGNPRDVQTARERTRGRRPRRAPRPKSEGAVNKRVGSPADLKLARGTDAAAMASGGHRLSRR